MLPITKFSLLPENFLFHSRGLTFLAISCVSLLMLVPAANAQYLIESGPTEISDIPWDPTALATQEKVIYGPDDRIDVFEEASSMRRRLAAATCALVDSFRLDNKGDGTFTLQTSAYRQFGLPPCDGEPFAEQPTAAFCSGFLAGEDIIVTAGHCFFNGDVGIVSIVFGFDMLDAETPVTVFDESQVYDVVEIIGRTFNSPNGNANDYAVLRLDRPVNAPDAEPLEIRREGTAPVGTQIGVIGHPSGLPKKIAFGGTTKISDTTSSAFFEANLDTYAGNSGSPVFNESTGVVEGILVRGAPDFVIPSGKDCFESNKLPDIAAAEESSKSTAFDELIPPLGEDPDPDPQQCMAGAPPTNRSRPLPGDLILFGVTALLLTMAGTRKPKKRPTA